MVYNYVFYLYLEWSDILKNRFKFFTIPYYGIE